MIIYVIRYTDMKRRNTKVSQEGYLTLEAAQEFCRSRCKNRPYVRESLNGHVFYDDLLQQKYTIEEVSVAI